MPGKAKAKPSQRRHDVSRRPAAQQTRLVRRRPATARRSIKVKSHLRTKRPRGLVYKKARQSVEIGVCNKCGETCFHCRAQRLVARVDLKRERGEKCDPPTADESEAAGSDSLARDLAHIMEHDASNVG